MLNEKLLQAASFLEMHLPNWNMSTSLCLSMAITACSLSLFMYVHNDVDLTRLQKSTLIWALNDLHCRVYKKQPICWLPVYFIRFFKVEAKYSIFNLTYVILVAICIDFWVTDKFYWRSFCTCLVKHAETIEIQITIWSMYHVSF